MGALVMPSAVVAAILAPLGLESIGFLGMDIGLRWILFVAENTANQPGAFGHVAAPDTRVLPLIALGLLIIVLWQGHLRMAGGIAVAAGFLLWSSSERPALLVADTGGFMGLTMAEGRDLSRATGHDFVAEIWLENDGAPVPQQEAAAREGIESVDRLYRATLGDWSVLLVPGKTALDDLEDCGGADVLISNQDVTSDKECLAFDQTALRQSGSLAIDTMEGRLLVQSARQASGVRP